MTFFPATWAATSTLDGGNPRSSSTDGTRSPTLSVLLAGAPKSADLSETVVRRFFYRDALSVCARARARARAHFVVQRRRRKRRTDREREDKSLHHRRRRGLDELEFNFDRLLRLITNNQARSTLHCSDKGQPSKRKTQTAEKAAPCSWGPGDNHTYRVWFCASAAASRSRPHRFSVVRLRRVALRSLRTKLQERYHGDDAPRAVCGAK